MTNPSLRNRCLRTVIAAASTLFFCFQMAGISHADALDDIYDRADKGKYEVVRYFGFRALQCRSCSNLQRIYAFPPKRNFRTHKVFRNVSVSKQDLTKVVKRLVPGREEVTSVSLKRQGDNYLLEADFITDYSKGKLQNTARFIIERERSYGAIGVSPSLSTSRKLMREGFALIRP